jgi:GTPase Era involved in 16S rRNA processing
MDPQKTTHNNTRGTFSFHKEALRLLFTKAYQFCVENRNRDAIPHLERAREQLEKERMALAAVGEFKNGKSSLVNALLEEPELLPVDIDVTTSINTLITYAESENVTVVFGSGRSAKKLSIDRKQIRDYVTEQQNASNKKNVSMVVIELPNEQLAEGLVLYDTPGIGNVNRSHEAMTFSILHAADVILFIHTAEVELLDTTLDFIEKRLAVLNVPLLFALTKIDVTTRFMDRVDSFRRLLSARLKKDPEEFVIIPVSSKNKLDYLRTQDPEDLSDSNFQELEDEIWRLLTSERGKIVLMPAALEIGTSITEARSPLAATLETLESTAAEMKPIEDLLRESANRLMNLGNTDAQWATALKAGFDNLRQRIDRDFKTGAIEVRTRLRKLCISNLEVREIVESINGELALLSVSCAKVLQEQAGVIAAEVERHLPENENPFASSSDKPGIDPTLRTPKRHFWDRFNDVGFAHFRGSMKGGLIGGAIGGIVGAFLGGIGAIPGSIIGAKVGAVMGAIVELGKTFLGIRREDKSRDRYDALLPEVEKQLVMLQSGLTGAVDAVQKQLEEETRNELTRRRQDIERTVNAIHETLRSQFQMSGQEVRQRINELKKKIADANSLLQELDELIGDIMGRDSAQHAS